MSTIAYDDSIGKARQLSSVMKKSIGTHNGAFHADEAFACALLKRLPAFASHSIIRTRDSSVLNQCDVVVDVGGVYEHAEKRYDHHQVSEAFYCLVDV